MGPSYRVPIVASVPILLFATLEFLSVAAAAVVILLIVLMMGFSFFGMENVVFGACAPVGITLAIRDRLFVPMALNPLARFIRVRAFLSSLGIPVVAFFAIDSFFKQSPWIVNLVLALGYVALARYLRAGVAAKTVYSRRARAGNAALAVLGILVSLLVLELGARYVIRIPLPPLPSHDIIQADDAALWVPRPSSTRTYPASLIQGRSEDFTVTHSAAGSRGAEVALKAENEFRIVILGDSFAYGWGVNDDEHVGEQLQRLAATTQPRPVTVINLGVPGHSPWQEFERLKRWGIPLAPDLVVLQLYPNNDIPDTLMKDSRVLPAFGDETVEIMRYWRDHTRWDLRLERTLRASCALYNTYRALWPANDSVAVILQRLRFFHRSREQFSPVHESQRTWWMEVMLKDWYPLLDTARREFEQDVLDIVQYCQSHELPILVYSVPFGKFGQSSWQAAVAESHEKSGDDIAYEQFKDSCIVEAFFRENDIPWVPLFEKFRERPDPDALYFPGDGHLNEQGNSFVAKLIFDRVVRDGYLHGPAVDPTR